MSSVLRSFSQVRNRNLTVVGTNISVFTLANIQTATATNFKRLSPTLYIANTLTDLKFALNALNTLSTPILDTNEETVQDLGKTVRIGLQSDPNILVLRLVRHNDIGLASNNTTGYVVIENKLDSLYNPVLNIGVVAPGGGF